MAYLPRGHLLVTAVVTRIINAIAPRPITEKRGRASWVQRS
jgi:hypothetical protein